MRILQPILATVVASLLLAAAAPAVDAQFTSTVTAPRPEKPAVVEARRDSLRQADSVSVVERMTEMREWVDSAAQAIAADAPPATDVVQDTVSSTPATSTGAIVPEREPAAPPAAFENGAPAPDTATPLPFIALVGLGSLAAGALLRRRAR